MRDIAANLRKIADASRRQDGSDIPLGEQVREAADLIDSLTRERDEARAANIASPAECYSGCEDRECPYTHSPLTWEQAYDNQREQLSAASSRISALEAELERARSALKPFAKALRANEANNLSLASSSARYDITMGDLRRARSLLLAKGEGNG